MRRALRRALRSLIDAALLAAVIVAPLLAPDAVPAGAQVPAGPPLFETLFNGDFELGPNPTGWERRGGTLEVMETGAGRAAFLRSSTTSTKWIEQPVRIEGGVAYQASARLGTDAGVAGGLVRIAWYASEDGSGSQLATVDSPEVGPAAAPALLSTGSRVAPAEARSARVRLVLRPASAESAALAIDDVTFARVGPPAPTPTPTPTPSPPPDPAAAPVAPPEPSKSPPPPE
ncbi:MAG: hypothetical protein FJZ92_12590, partial [Chloroflexi bacterium]|nr:hypothetical protein [Chloroflexota bacterium]